MKHIVKYHEDCEKSHPVQNPEMWINNSIISMVDCEEKYIERGNCSSSLNLKNEERKIKMKVKCDKCGLYLDNQSKLEWHVKKVHCRTSFYCPKCKAYFPTDHLTKMHPELLDKCFYQCKFCDKQFMKESDNLLHLGLEHSCNICKRIVSSRRGIEAHMKEIHNESFTFPQSKRRKLPEVPEAIRDAKTDTDKSAPKLSCVAICDKLCGKCGSSYVKLKVHKQLCSGMNSFLTNNAGVEKKR